MRFSTLLVATTIAASCHPTVNPSSVNVVCGTPVSEEMFPQVFALIREINASSSELTIGVCTASWITPQFAITAAHCLPTSSSMIIGLRPNEFSVQGVRPFTRAYVPPMFAVYDGLRDPRAGSVDVGLIFAKVPLADATLARYRNPVVIGTPVELLGFGSAKQGPDPRTSLNPELTYGQNNVSAVGNVISIKGPGWMAPCVKGRDTLTVGDSGGPLLIQGRIAGVAAEGAPDRTTAEYANIVNGPAKDFLDEVADLEPEIHEWMTQFFDLFPGGVP